MVELFKCLVIVIEGVLKTHRGHVFSNISLRQNYENQPDVNLQLSSYPILFTYISMFQN